MIFILNYLKKMADIMRDFKESDFKLIEPDYKDVPISDELEKIKSIHRKYCIDISKSIIRMIYNCKHEFKNCKFENHVSFQKEKYLSYMGSSSFEGDNIQSSPEYQQYLKDYPDDESLCCSICGLDLKRILTIKQDIDWKIMCQSVMGW